MKTFGYLLIALGFIDMITNWALEDGSPIDPIVGPTIAPFTVIILMSVGGFMVQGLGEKDKEEGE